MKKIIELKKLILDERFTSLRTMVNKEINLMSILNVAHRELQHSNFLAWLFNPTETHSQGQFFIKEFIKLYYKENNYDDLGSFKSLSVFDFVKLDLSDLDIQREHKNIDLLLTSEENKLVICIENKIFASESKGQLTKYRKYVEDKYPKYDFRIYIYLSLFDQQISESEQEFYVSITYDHIIKMLHNTLTSESLSSNVKFIISQYITSLKVIMNDNSEIEELALQLYKDYKSSFDLVFKYVNPTSIPGSKSRVPNSIKEKIENDLRLLKSPTNKTYIRFMPLELYEFRYELIKLDIIPADYDIQNRKLFWFEFMVRETQITFKFLIGDFHYKESRKRLYEHYLKKNTLFTSLKDTLSKRWTTCVSYKIISTSDFNSMNEEELQQKINSEYEYVIGDLVPKIVSHLKDIAKTEQGSKFPQNY